MLTSISGFQSAASFIQSQVDKANNYDAGKSNDKFTMTQFVVDVTDEVLASINNRLMRLERAFRGDEVLSGSVAYHHVVFAPSATNL